MGSSENEKTTVIVCHAILHNNRINIGQIGGSLSGLLHGVMLSRNGYNVTILEQDPAEKRVGIDVGIHAGNFLVEFLDKHDVVRRPLTVDVDTVHVMKKHEYIAWKMSRKLSMTSRGLLMSILRANFDGTVSQAVPQIPTLKKNWNNDIHDWCTCDRVWRE